MSKTGVLVLDNNKRPLMPTCEARARELLKKGRAAIFRRFPFTIVMKDRESGDVQPTRLKIDPGSKETGIAVVNEVTKKVIFVMVLVHRGQQISSALKSRNGLRRNRRGRNTRYRRPGLPNTQKPEGWLAPSLLHRVQTTMTWVERLRKFSPISALSLELVRFDMQKIENPEISGIEYQQGELFGYEVKQYLLEKFGYQCIYCGKKEVPLEVEHILAKANGGTDRVSNLGIACRPCNEAKDDLLIEVFLKGKPELLGKIQKQLKASLKDAAAVNSIRKRLYQELQKTGLPVETGSGGRTKFNRTKLQLPKEHWIDAACVGVSGEAVVIHQNMKPLVAKATGHGNRQMCGTNKYGFPIRHRGRQKVHFGFQTGDMVRANISKGKNTGVHSGRVLCRKTGYFDITTKVGRIGGISHRYCKKIHGNDGYGYSV